MYFMFICRDSLLRLLNNLTAKNNIRALKRCRLPELCLKETLERHVKDLKAEEAVDEVLLCNELLDRIFPESSINQENNKISTQLH